MQFHRLFPLIWLLVMSVCPEPLCAAEELTQLVGPDVSICVEASQPAEHLAALKGSAFFQRLRNSSIYRGWLAGRAFQRLTRARQHIERQTGRPFGQFAEDLFGESVVLALYPAAEGKLAGVLLTRTAGAEVLQSALELWNRGLRQKPERIEHAGQTYFRRTKSQAEKRRAKTQYYVSFGGLFALSDQERLIRQVIDLRLKSLEGEQTGGKTAGGAEPRNLFASPTYQRSRRALSPETAISIYVNPRSLEAALKQREQKPDPPKVLREVWRRQESLALGVRLNQGIVVEGVLHYDGPADAENWSRLITRTSGTPDFLQKIPRRALIGFAGRHDLAGFAKLLLDFVPQPQRERWKGFRQVARGLLLGRDLFDDVLPRFQPNWGLYVTPALEPRREMPPVDALLALRFSPGEGKRDAGEGEVGLRDALHNALNTGLNLMAADHNRKSPEMPAVVRSRKLSPTKLTGAGLVRWIEGLGDIQPAYAITTERLLFSTSPELIEKFVREDAAAALGRDGRLQHWSRSFFPRANQVLFVNVPAVREFFADKRELFVRHASRSQSVAEGEARARLSRLDDALGLFDGAFLAGRIFEDHVRLVAGAVVDEPAKESGDTGR